MSVLVSNFNPPSQKMDHSMKGKNAIKDPQDFDLQCFRELDSQERKKQYLITTTERLILKLNSGKFQATPASIPFLRDLLEQFADYTDDLNDQNRENLCKAIVACQLVFGAVPASPKYLNLGMWIIEHFNPSNDLHARALRSLILNSGFCETFLAQGYISIILKKVSEDWYPKVLCLFNGPVFFNEVFKIDGISLVGQMMAFTIAHMTEQRKSVLANIEFLFKLIKHNFTHYQDMTVHLDKVAGELRKINVFLLEDENQDEIWRLYSYILDGGESDISVCKFWVSNVMWILASEQLQPQPKLKIMQKMAKIEGLYRRGVCDDGDHFPISNLVNEAILRDDQCMSVFFDILDRSLAVCVDDGGISDSFLTMPVFKLLHLLKPPMKNGLQYNLAFEWLWKIVVECNIKPLVFHDELFFGLFILDNEEAKSWFELPGFRNLFIALTDPERNADIEEEILVKVFDLGVSEYLEPNYNFAFTRFLVKHIENPDMREMLFRHVGADTPSHLRIGNVFSFLDFKSETFMRLFLLFIRKMVEVTNDHMFDEFVILQRRDSPLFSLSSEIVTDVVYDHEHHNGALWIPSLVPLLNEVYDTDSPYNLYLLGRYAVPVYLELGKKVPRLEKIGNQFIRYEDYKFLLEQNQIDLELCRKEVVTCYEFVPGTYGTIKLPGQESPQVLAFLVKFEDSQGQTVPFLKFNGVTVSFCGTDIVLPNGNRLPVIVFGAWHKFVLKTGSIMNWTQLFIDDQKVYTVRGSFVFNCIGSESEPIHTRFSVAKNILYLFNKADSRVLNLYNISVQKEMNVIASKTVGLAPVHSIATILCDDFWLFQNVDRLDVWHTEEIFDFVLKQLDFLSVAQQEHFLRRLNSSLVEIGKLEWIERFVKKLFTISDREMKTQIFIEFFYDCELWVKLNSDDLAHLCNQIDSLLCSADLDFERVLQKDKFHFLLGLMNLIGQSSIVYYVIRRLGEKLESVQKLVPIVMISGSWKPNMHTRAADFDTEMVHNFRKTNELQMDLVQFMVYFEHLRDQQYLGFDELALLSLCLSRDLGCTMFERLLMLLENDPMGISKLPLISLISMEFANVPAMWSRVIRKATGHTRFSIQNEEQIGQLATARVIFPGIFCLLFSMAAAVVDLDKTLAKKALDAVIKLVSGNASLLLEDPVLEYFIVVVSCGRVRCPLDFANVIDSIQFPELQPYELTTLKNSIKSHAGDFALNLNDMLQMYENTSPMFIGFATALGMNLCSRLSSDKKKLRKLFGAIICNGHPTVVLGIVKHFCRQTLLSSFTEDVQSMAATGLCHCAANFPIVFDADLRTTVIQMQKFFPGILNQFCVYSVEYMGSEMASQVMELLSPSQWPKAALVMLIRIVLHDVSVDYDCNQYLREIKEHIVPDESREYALLSRSDSFSQFVAAVKSSGMEDHRVQNLTMKPAFDDMKITVTIGEKVCSYLFFLCAKNCIQCFVENQRFYFSFNSMLRMKEKTLAMHYKRTSVFQSQSMTASELREKTKSFHISPFGTPATPRIVMLPSLFSVETPSSEHLEVRTPVTAFFSMKPTLNPDIPLTDEYPERLFRFGSLFECTTNTLTQHFKEVFGDFQEMGECELTRLNLRIPSVYFRIGEDLFVLCDTTIKDKVIHFRKTTPFLAEAVLQNEFGPYSIFCGHFVIIIRRRDIILAHKYVSCAIMRAKMIYSVQGGSFVLENVRYPAYCAHSLFAHTLQRAVEEFQASEISVLDFLTVINTLGYRSFSDLTAYPIFPWLVVDFNAENPFEHPRLRDLSVPIPIFADTDPEHKAFISRFSIQHFHHAENVSNPVIVSSFNFRLLPFSRYMWEVNQGWDHADRNFMSIPFHLTISNRRAYELVPELFCFPEVLLNVNNFQLPDGTSFDLALPDGVEDVYRFIERHRAVLESRECAAHIHQWLDLIFGCKQASLEALNMFSPLSYQSEKRLKDQRMWMLTCGQVPKQVFAEPAPEKTVFVDEFRPENVRFQLISRRSSDVINMANDYQISVMASLLIRKSDTVIAVNDLVLPLSTKIHQSISQDEQYLAITFSVSVVMVVRIIYKNNQPCGFQSLSRLICRSPQFSVICSRQLICATVCRDYIVLWSLSTGMVVSVIEVPDVSALIFDEPMGTIYAGQGKTLHQLTMNGNLIRKFEYASDILSLSVCGNGFSFKERMILSGHVDGSVRIASVSDDGDVVVHFTKRVCPAPIVEIKGEQNSYTVKVVRMT